MENASNTFEESKANLKEILRESSKNRLQILAKIKEIELFEIFHNPIIYANGMVLILVSGQGIRITLKCHFMSEAAKHFSQKPYGKLKSEISFGQAADFVKELANVLAGQIKSHLEKSNMASGISLPLLTRGFDEIFFPFTESETSFKDHWRLMDGDYNIDFSVHYELKSKGLNISKADSGDVDNVGDVEFF